MKKNSEVVGDTAEHVLFSQRGTTEARNGQVLICLGLARSVCQVFNYRIYVCPLHPCSVACSFADLEGFTIPSSFPQTPPPFMHSSLHTSPSTPSVTSLTITGSSQLQNGCGLELPKKIRQEYGVYTEIRCILPYIRRINMYIRKYGIRIRRGEAGRYGVYTVP